MTKFAAFIIILVLRIIYQPSNAQKDIAPFTTPSPVPVSAKTILPVIQIGINNNSRVDNMTLFNRDKGEASVMNKNIMTSLID